MKESDAVGRAGLDKDKERKRRLSPVAWDWTEAAPMIVTVTVVELASCCRFCVALEAGRKREGERVVGTPPSQRDHAGSCSVCGWRQNQSRCE